jgi:tetratricopeptide (TPR) repeat protein
MADEVDEGIKKWFFLTEGDSEESPYDGFRDNVLDDLLRTGDYTAGVAAIEQHIATRDRGLIARASSFSGYKRHVKKNLETLGIEKPLLALHRIKRSRRRSPDKKLVLDDILKVAYDCADDFAMAATVVLAYEMKYFTIPRQFEEEGTTQEEAVLFEREQKVYADGKVADALEYLKKAKDQRLSSSDAQEQMRFLLNIFPALCEQITYDLNSRAYSQARAKIEQSMEIVKQFAQPGKQSIVSVDGTLNYLMARTYLEEHDTAEAVRYLQAAIFSPEQTFSDKTQHVDAHTQLITLHTQHKNLAGAQEILTLAEQCTATTQEQYVAIARLCYEEKRAADVVATLHRGIEKCPAHEKLEQYKRDVVGDWYEKGKKATNSKDYADARQYFRQVIALEPTHLKAYFKIAASYHAQGGRGIDARQWYRKALVLDGSYVPAHLGIAQSYETDGRKADAITSYQKVLCLDRNNTEAKEGVARLGGT